VIGEVIGEVRGGGGRDDSSLRMRSKEMMSSCQTGGGKGKGGDTKTYQLDSY
jgi:hypothetical protein